MEKPFWQKEQLYNRPQSSRSRWAWRAFRNLSPMASCNKWRALENHHQLPAVWLLSPCVGILTGTQEMRRRGERAVLELAALNLGVDLRCEKRGQLRKTVKLNTQVVICCSGRQVWGRTGVLTTPSEHGSGRQGAWIRSEQRLKWSCPSGGRSRCGWRRKSGKLQVASEQGCTGLWKGQASGSIPSAPGSHRLLQAEGWEESYWFSL